MQKGHKVEEGTGNCIPRLSNVSGNHNFSLTRTRYFEQPALSRCGQLRMERINSHTPAVLAI